MQTHQDAFSGWEISFNTSDRTRIDCDGYMCTALRFHAESGKDAASLFDEPHLKNFTNSYYRHSAAQLAHSALMRPAQVPSTATARFVQDRLLVRAIIAHLMTVIFVALLILVVVAAFMTPSKGVLPHNPSTIQGLFSILMFGRRCILPSLENLGAARVDAIQRQIGQSLYFSWTSQRKRGCSNSAAATVEFGVSGTQGDPSIRNTPNRSERWHPMVLRPILRSSGYVLIAGLIITLELTFRKSEVEDGLGAVANDDNLHYAWTITPAVVMSLTSMFLVAVGFELRALAPIWNLFKGQRSLYRSTIGLDILDRAAPLAIIEELRTRNFASLAISISAVISLFLTIFSGTLFEVHSTPVSAIGHFETVTSFGRPPGVGQYDTDTSTPQLVTSLIPMNNLSYPDSTLEDLAFPTFKLLQDSGQDTRTSIMDTTVSSSLAVRATLPAVRSRLRCRRYGMQDLKFKKQGMSGRSQ
jgi:hypothetical protein